MGSPSGRGAEQARGDPGQQVRAGFLSRRPVDRVRFRSDGKVQVYVREFPDGKSFAVSTEGGAEPRWSADGSELYFRRGDSLYAISVSTESGIEVAAARLILKQPFDRNTYRDRAAYDVAADGRFLVVTNTWNTEF